MAADTVDVRAEVQRRVADVAAKAGDDEAAHIAEDALRLDLLRYLAAGMVPAEQVREVCELAASTASIDFERWCA